MSLIFCSNYVHVQDIFKRGDAIIMQIKQEDNYSEKATKPLQSQTRRQF